MKRIIILLLKPLSFLPAILILYIIFMLSAQPGHVSSDLSHKVSHKVVTVTAKLLDKDLSHDQINHYIARIHMPIRKLAHVTAYFILAIAVSFPFYVYGLRGFPLMLVAGFICVGAAALDEYHQSFVAGRGPSVRDVMIDSIGIFCGIMTVRIICWSALAGSRRRALKKARKR
jgi:Predicted integral membrane protein